MESGLWKFRAIRRIRHCVRQKRRFQGAFKGGHVQKEVSTVQLAAEIARCIRKRICNNFYKIRENFF
jgi:hypothetical protein